MPHYYFHLMMGTRSLSHDTAGHDCADDAAARQHAQSGAGFLIPGKAWFSRSKRHHLEVVTQEGKSIFKVLLADLVAK